MSDLKTTISVNGGPEVPLDALHKALDTAMGKPGHGHNSGEPAPAVGGIASDRLRSLIERVERLEEERKALSADIRDIFVEAKSAGFDVKVMRRIIAQRKREPAEVEEEETLLETYRRALGM